MSVAGGGTPFAPFHGGGNRTSRDLRRNRARFLLRERVVARVGKAATASASASASATASPEDDDDAVGESSCPPSLEEDGDVGVHFSHSSSDDDDDGDSSVDDHNHHDASLTALTPSDVASLTPLIRAVESGSSQAFGLRRISDNYDLLTRPVPIQNYVNAKKMTEVIRSRFGEDWMNVALEYCGVEPVLEDADARRRREEEARRRKTAVNGTKDDDASDSASSAVVADEEKSGRKDNDSRDMAENGGGTAPSSSAEAAPTPPPAHLRSVTVMEYASLMGEYDVVASLLSGKVDPTVRGRSFQKFCSSSPGAAADDDDVDDAAVRTRRRRGAGRRRRRDEATSARVSERLLLRKGVPLPLSAYLVKSAVEMRVRGHHRRRRRGLVGGGGEEGDAAVRFCDVCGEEEKEEKDQTLCDFSVGDREGGGGDKKCGHSFCEPCLWSSILSGLDDSTENSDGADVVRCPRCDEPYTGDCGDGGGGSESACGGDGDCDGDDGDSPERRRLQSLERYLSLPADTSELKSLTRKKSPHKRKPPKRRPRNFVPTNWHDAILPAVGYSRDVRGDKFLKSVEANALQHVRVYLKEGVDVNMRNEYGQTPLCVASWRGYREVVEALLRYGADAGMEANGGMTCAEAARTNGRDDVVELLLRQRRRQCRGDLSEDTERRRADDDRKVSTLAERLGLNENDSSSPSEHRPAPLRHLIPPTSSHPGANSFVIDDALPPSVLTSLLELREALPEEDSADRKKNKDIICSMRSYLCDAEGGLTAALGECVRRGLLSAATADAAEESSAETEGERARPGAADDSDSGGENEKRTTTTTTTMSGTKETMKKSGRGALFFPHMRYLSYSRPGGSLAPHVDLNRVHPFLTSPPSSSSSERNGHSDGGPVGGGFGDGGGGGGGGELRSTHTFILYLTTPERGGETALLRELRPRGESDALAVVSPRRGRLLLFPHSCPHEGRATAIAATSRKAAAENEKEEESPHKVLLRGEAWIG